MSAQLTSRPAARISDRVTINELVWDRDHPATAVNGQGQSFTIGNGWGPEALFALGVESDLMTTFLYLADEFHVDVLAYLSASRIATVDDGPPTLVIAVSIVLAADTDPAATELVWREARSASVIARMLGSLVRVDAEVSIVTDHRLAKRRSAC